jgi:hypothetical protein
MEQIQNISSHLGCGQGVGNKRKSWFGFWNPVEFMRLSNEEFSLLNNVEARIQRLNNTNMIIA